MDQRPLTSRTVVRVGVHAWAVLGVVGALWVLLQALGYVSLVVLPLVIALLPAAILSPASQWLKRKGVRPGLAAAIVLFGFLLGLAGLVAALGTLIAGELGEVFSSVREAYADIRTWADDTLGVALPSFDDLIDQAEEWATGEDGLMADVGGTATAAVETVSSVLLGLIALFFYLKDGERIAAFTVELLPVSVRDHAVAVGDRVWFTLGAYFRGQLVVAAVDAVLIGLGLVILGVPLAPALAALVFIGGLFPVVGAFVAGAVAVLIALADSGLGLALAVLALNVIVQQAEGNLLEPLIVGRATKLHPLVVLTALTAGALTAGILGAFLAVPFAACLVRAGGYVLEQRHGEPVGDGPPQGEGAADDPGAGADESGQTSPGSHR